MVSEKRNTPPGGQPKAGDLQNLGPLGRPMKRDELVEGAKASDRAGAPSAGDVQAEGALGRPMTRDELVDKPRSRTKP
jgi:hypothetical protein